MDVVQQSTHRGAIDGTDDVTGRCARGPVTCLGAIILIGTAGSRRDAHGPAR